MILTGKTTLKSGFVFDYANMLGTGRIQVKDVLSIKDKIIKAADGLAQIRNAGISKGHFSKDGIPEQVLFTRLPFVEKNNPNTNASISRLLAFSKDIWNNTDVVVFFGIGGSYLGGKVLFDVNSGAYWNQCTNKERDGFPQIYFSGNNVDSRQYEGLLTELKRQAGNKKFSHQGKTSVMLIPISKSGTTLETTTAYLFFYERLRALPELFNVDAAVVTDLETTGPLQTLAIEHNWRTFPVHEGVGGRFSVLSEPGLIVGATIGMDIEKLLEGAKDMENQCLGNEVENNPALLNAALKYLSGEKYGCAMEVFMPYAMKLKSLAEWYVQLLAESLGKRSNRQGVEVNYGRTPIAAVGTLDMHAQTQQHQDGQRNKVIQFVEIGGSKGTTIVSNPFPQIKAYEKYQGLDVDEALSIALAANAQALNEDNRFNATYYLPELTPYYLGQLMYFLMLSVAYEGEMADVDAYNQPGVETYKRIMNNMLKKGSAF
ncbi:MAG: glucose-6-phosphate isomerase [Acidaminococcaceae bacterium]|nr:glucose-6-phosphate isomerase [Acidaminococcaceae bacterium]MDD4721918.1 glucose-6-phosphate isomerase [Acidaminococcaceae bacterium]